MRIPTLLLAFLVVAAGCGSSPVQVSVDASRRFQVMSGWEITAELDKMPSAEYLDFVVNEVGINRVRLEIRSGAENTKRAWSRRQAGEIDETAWRALRYETANDNDDPMVINEAGFDFSEIDQVITSIVQPMQARLAARGERLSVNLCYVAFTDQIESGQYLHKDPAEYAEFILATSLHLRSRFDVVPDTWEVLLEPDQHTGWDGKDLGRAIVATAGRLRASKFTPRFIAPSVSYMANFPGYLNGIAAVPGAMEEIAELSYHRYGLRSASQLAVVADRARRYGKPTSMLELWFGQATPDMLHEDLVGAGNVAWQGATFTSLVELDDVASRGPRFRMKPDTRIKAPYFRNIRAGATRLAASSSSPGWVDPVAFVNPDKTHVVVVNAAARATVSVSGLPAGTYIVGATLTNGGAIAAGPRSVTQGQALTVTLPSAGVASIAGQK